MMKGQRFRFILGAAAIFIVLTALIRLSDVPVKEGYQLILQGAIGLPPEKGTTLKDSVSIAWDNTLHEMTVLLLAGLSVAIALQAGLFNIGAAGQLMIGACTAAWIGTREIPAPLHLPLTLLCGALSGALWALLPALLKIWRGAHEVITTIMFNYIALYFTHWLVTEVIKDPATDAPRTATVLPSAELAHFGEFTAAGWGLMIALLIAVVLAFVLFRSVWGYELRAVGANAEAAEAAGIPVKWRMMTGFLLAGGLAGLAGAIEVCGYHRNFFEGFPAEYGFDGIAVALLAGNHPAWAVGTSWLFSMLRNGAYNMHVVTGAPKEIAVIVQAFLILYVASLRFKRSRLEAS